MLFDLSQIKIRRSFENISFDEKPVQLFRYEKDRIVVIIYTWFDSTNLVSVANSLSSLIGTFGIDAAYYLPLEIYGPDEIWIRGFNGTEPAGGRVVYQSVYRDD